MALYAAPLLVGVGGLAISLFRPEINTRYLYLDCSTSVHVQLSYVIVVSELLCKGLSYVNYGWMYTRSTRKVERSLRETGLCISLNVTHMVTWCVRAHIWFLVQNAEKVSQQAGATYVRDMEGILGSGVLRTYGSPALPTLSLSKERHHANRANKVVLHIQVMITYGLSSF